MVTPREKRRYDKTYLSTEKCETLHRDYIAHALRWGFAFKFCMGKKVLDVGCGKEYPFGKLLVHHGRQSLRPSMYVGLDMNKLPEKRLKFIHLYGQFDFTERFNEVIEQYGKFDVITNFEVLEHMQLTDGYNLLCAVKECLTDDGTFLLSTPVLAAKGPARNHIHEYSVSELTRLLTDVGFNIVKRYGTYGNVPSIRKSIKESEKTWQLQTMQELSEYYSHDVMATFLAPLYPDACKNNLWLLKK
jgi:2-polyprenyl-3-methyl-5-hydroxy-6-metoxy-1,4-benzoquinol methylase